MAYMLEQLRRLVAVAEELHFGPALAAAVAQPCAARTLAVIEDRIPDVE